MPRIQLKELAHARSGDKGDTVNIGLIAYRPEHYPLLVELVTAERVRAHFTGIVHGTVERFELPNLHALNFLLHGALDGRAITEAYAAREPGITWIDDFLGSAPAPRAADEAMAPPDVAALCEYVLDNRSSDTPFDIVIEQGKVAEGGGDVRCGSAGSGGVRPTRRCDACAPHALADFRVMARVRPDGW